MKLNFEIEYDWIKGKEYLEKLRERKAFVELKEVRKARTNQQNKYLHAIITEWACEVGYTLQEMKYNIKAALGYVYHKNGCVMYRETSKMNTEELSIFTDKLRKLAAEQGVYLMSPDEFEQGGWKSIAQKKETMKRYL